MTVRTVPTPNIYPDQKRAMAAIHAAYRLWGGPIARVLEDEIKATYEFMPYLGKESHVRKLIEQILDLEAENR